MLLIWTLANRSEESRHLKARRAATGVTSIVTTKRRKTCKTEQRERRECRGSSVNVLSVVICRPMAKGAERRVMACVFEGLVPERVWKFKSSPQQSKSLRRNDLP